MLIHLLRQISAKVKKTLLIFIIYSILGNAHAQELSIGVKINSGAGRIHSNNLQKSFKMRKALDEEIIQWEATSKSGFNFGIGGFIEYSINDNASLIGELTYNFSNSTISIDRIDDGLDINGNGGGDIKIIESEAAIKLSYLQLSILKKYYFSGAPGFYALGGFGFNYIETPGIESSETETTKVYDNFNLVETTTTPQTISADLNEFNSTGLSFIMGAGTDFELYGRKLSVDIRFNLALTKSAMFTTDEVYDDITYINNDVFSVLGKNKAESEAPAYILDDFKTSMIMVSIGYSLFNKSNIQKDEQNTL